MKLKTKDLKQFLSVAKTISQNRVMPILSYIKFDNGKITKSNLESFVTMLSDFDGSCLIDEKILTSFVSSIKADEINVDVKETVVKLSVGKEKISSPTEEVDNFPETLQPVGEGIEIDQQVFNAIRVASQFTLDVDNMPMTKVVFVGNGIVGATFGQIAYVENSGDGLPNIIIEKPAQVSMKNFTEATFSENETYQFYSVVHNSNIFNYGFIKKDTKFLDMRPFVKVPDGEKFSIHKNEIVKFCDTCVTSCQGRPVVAEIKGDKLIMVDSAYGIDYERPLPLKLPDFTFNPVLMAKMLKALPNEMIEIIPGEHRLYITGQAGFTSLIMKQKPTNQ